MKTSATANIPSAELLSNFIKSDFLEQLAKSCYQQFQNSNNHNENINNSLENQFKQALQKSGIPEKAAANFAHTHLNKLSGHYSKVAQKSLGVSKYRWRSSCDQKTRDEHLLREGKIFLWDKPPHDGHPGYADGCRCWAEPILPEMEELDSLLFGKSGDNRHYHAEMVRRGLKPAEGMPSLPTNPEEYYGYRKNKVEKIKRNTINLNKDIKKIKYSLILKTIKNILFNSK